MQAPLHPTSAEHAVKPLSAETEPRISSQATIPFGAALTTGLAAGFWNPWQTGTLPLAKFPATTFSSRKEHPNLLETGQAGRQTE